MSESWRDVWERKGQQATQDLKELDGFESTSVDPKRVADSIQAFLKIKSSDRVLEIGCGAGMLGQHFDCHYIGLDYSASLLQKHHSILGNHVFQAEAKFLPFQTNSFDKVFVFSVFHYFPDKEYALQVVSAMQRVAKETLFIGDLPLQSPRQEHLLFCEQDFMKWECSPGFYNADRFNCRLHL